MLTAANTPILRGRKRKQAVEILKNGGVVAIPTETVYGLAADATSDAACRAVYRAKGRADDNPLIVHACNRRMFYEYTTGHPPYLQALLRAFTPGPLTIILPKTPAISAVATCNMPTVAVRIPQHRVARQIIAAVGRPLAAPSANLSGRLSPTNAIMVRGALAGRIDAIVDGGASRIGIESTIIRTEANQVTLLRPGVITAAMLRRALRGRAAVVEAAGAADSGASVTPGSRRTHYRPHTPLRLTDDLPRAVADQLCGADAVTEAAAQEAHSVAIGSIAVIAASRRQYRALRRALTTAMAANQLIRVARRRATSTKATLYRLRLPPRLKVGGAPQGSPLANDAAMRPCYCYRARNTRDYARVFYSLCHFFDQLAPTEIIAAYPCGRGGHADSLHDRLRRASERA